MAAARYNFIINTEGTSATWSDVTISDCTVTENTNPNEPANNVVINCVLSGNTSPKISTPDDLWSSIDKRYWEGHHNSRQRSCPPYRKSAPENKARKLLKRLIGDVEYRKYLINGFVMHQGKNGVSYQIFPGSRPTKIRENGIPIESLSVCVVPAHL